MLVTIIYCDRSGGWRTRLHECNYCFFLECEMPHGDKNPRTLFSSNSNMRAAVHCIVYIFPIETTSRRPLSIEIFVACSPAFRSQLLYHTIIMIMMLVCVIIDALPRTNSKEKYRKKTVIESQLLRRNDQSSMIPDMKIFISMTIRLFFTPGMRYAWNHRCMRLRQSRWGKKDDIWKFSDQNLCRLE